MKQVGRLTITRHRLITRSITGCTRSLESLAHMLKGSRVNLPTCIALLQDLQRCWPALHSNRWRRHWRTGASIQPADERPDEHYEQGNPEYRASRHHQPAPTKTITPHHNCNLTFVINFQEYFPEISRTNVTVRSQQLCEISRTSHGILICSTITKSYQHERL
jgi:hypothetical protein